MELSKGHLQGKVPQHRSLAQVLVSRCCSGEHCRTWLGSIKTAAGSSPRDPGTKGPDS